MKKYFSFIGTVLCREITDITKIEQGENIHFIDMSRGYISINEVKNKKNLVLISRTCGVDEDKGEYIFQYFLALKNAFDCNPAVPVAKYGENLANALS